MRRTWSTSIDVAAPPDRVFALLDGQDGLKAWWGALSAGAAARGWPTMDLTALGGPSAGAGMRFAFGMGGKTTEVWTVLRSTRPSEVVYEVDFQVFKVTRTMGLQAASEGTRVTWTETADVPDDSPSDDSIVANFDMALRVLKRVAER